MQRHRHHDQQVEDLVVAEGGGERIGSPRGVDDGADAVEDAADEYQEQAAKPGLEIDLGHRDDADPAERDGDDRGKPFRCAEPEEPDEDRGRAAAPDDRQYHGLPGAAQGEQPHRRVGAGDQAVDARVVEPAQPGTPTG
jgi:hypothetical protein